MIKNGYSRYKDDNNDNRIGLGHKGQSIERKEIDPGDPIQEKREIEERLGWD